jgi:bile acid:Na+ symporter, BASS family
MSRESSLLKTLSFPATVLVFVAVSIVRPQAFGVWFGADLKILIVPLIQIITFGMGTTLSAADFARVFKMPWPVLIGLILHFLIMPLVGFSIAMLLGFEPEVAAGIILIGSVSAGVASNLISYLALGNVALSVTMTACSTLAAPVMTPFWMKTLAGKLVPVDFMVMMFSIIDMIIVPIFAGLAANKILYGAKRWTKSGPVLAGIAAGCAVAAAAATRLDFGFLGAMGRIKSGLVIGFGLIAAVTLAKLVINVWRGSTRRWMDTTLPLISMGGICFIIAIITSRSRDLLLHTGVLLVVAAIMHNLTGYSLGYLGAKLARLNERDARTVAIEVGMQNGGMASGIAMDVLKSAGAALAPAIFGPWMNISGSLLAGWWRRRPIQDDNAAEPRGEEPA